MSERMIGLTVDFGDSVLVEGRRGVTIDESWIDSLFRRCSANGVDTVFWRASAAGVVDYPSRVMDRVDSYCGEDASAMVNLLQRFDPLKAAVELAHQHGVRVFVFITIADFYTVRPVMDLDVDFLATLKRHKLTLRQGGKPASISVDSYFHKNSHLCWTSRDERCHYKGVPSLAYDETVSRLLDQIGEVSEYGPDGVYLCTRTHSKDPRWYGYESDEPDGFGYEEPVRSRFQQLHNRDIRYEDFDREAWHRIKGEYLTGFLKKAKKLIEGRSQKLFFGIKPDRLSYLWAGTRNRSDFALLHKDWEGWSRDGILDGLVLITDRTVVDELGFVESFLKTVASPCEVYPWMNLNLPPLRTTEEVRRMGRAIRASGSPGVVYHEADDLRTDEGSGPFSDALWAALRHRG